MKKSSIDTWVFDLDNTLYPPEARLFDQIEAKMEAYMVRELGISPDQAKPLRSDFWRNHGTTLEGLVQVYGINPDPFLEEVHDIDHATLKPCARLKAALEELDGRRVIYTNGSRLHGEMVSRSLGIFECFDGIFGIEDAGYKPKPHRIAFDRVFDMIGLEPKRAAMFEDDPRNLAVPHELGMATVLVGASDPAPHIHAQTRDLASFLQQI